MEDKENVTYIKKKRLQKEYRFTCPRCGQICMTIAESELNKYQRTWWLLKMTPLSDTQIDEFMHLCEQGYRYIGVFCSNEKCNGEGDFVILNDEDWREHLPYAQIDYFKP